MLEDGSGSYNYYRNLDCRWQLELDSSLNSTDYKIRLRFPRGLNIAWPDSVLVYDGPNTTSPLLRNIDNYFTWQHEVTSTVSSQSISTLIFE